LVDKGYRYLMWCLTTAATRIISGKSRWLIAGVEHLAGLQHTIRTEVRLDDPCEDSVRDDARYRRILGGMPGVTSDS
jgi:hypothetical protein